MQLHVEDLAGSIFESVQNSQMLFNLQFVVLVVMGRALGCYVSCGVTDRAR